MTETAVPTINTAGGTDTPVIDSSSTLSPSNPQPNLEARLAHRPDPKDLLDRNILHGTGPATIQAQQDDLKHAMIVDNLKKGLATRPERHELEERGILPDSHVAPALLGHKKELEKSMLTDSLNTKLASRPEPEEVMAKGILNGMCIFPLEIPLRTRPHRVFCPWVFITS
ncbi:hypothetical protein Dda_3112 [Drechslerella dactyloides]|uniref:RPEL repeat protein n=1 Tax=Drechslerella dactyloides TaxID=74499 RepID=A0AAD6J340_DREDA|nr:hypothetical protein Dda_3112 [Drechslerella dactyloides]